MIQIIIIHQTKISFNMTSKTNCFLAFTLIAIFQITYSQILCPISSQNDLFIDAISIGLDISSTVVLNTTADVKCFNYTLQSSFSSLPQVAVALKHFQSSYGTSNLFLSIKPLATKVNDYSKLSFIVRTQWSYTNWKLIKFSFLAQQRNDIQASFYQIQTGYLGDCESTGKAIQIYLPFKTVFVSSPIVLLFLNGFQISTDSSLGYQTPYEVQTAILNKNVTGVSLSLTVTTSTKVLGLVVSYVAYDSRLQNVQSDILNYQQYSPIHNLSFSINSGFRSIFHGITGFIIGNSYNSALSLDSVYNSNNFTIGISASTSIQFMSYSYLGVNGNVCSLCQGYNIYFANSCLAACPANTYLNGQTCLSCSNTQYWNGTQCVQLCTGGRYWNATIGACICPNQQTWTGSVCTACPSGQFYNSTINSCQCLNGAYWNGLNCISCIGGMTWNSLNSSCQCPNGMSWNSTNCVYCVNGQIWNSTTSICQCPAGLNYNGTACISCTGGRYWNSTQLGCQCVLGSNWNGTVCLGCSQPRIWNATSLLCSCPLGSNWTGYTCLNCFGGQVYNVSINSCQCPTATNWNGTVCVTCTAGQVWNTTINACSCPNGYNWNANLSACIPSVTSCQNGLIYNATIGICQCPAGSNWNGLQCVTCYGSSIWNSSSYQCYCTGGMNYLNGVCSCPTNYYFNNGNCAAMQNCSNGSVFNGSGCVNVCAVGSYYNGTSCVSYVPSCPNSMYWNIIVCVYIVQNCPSGMTWNGTLCVTTSTQCPSGNYYWNGTSCIIIGQKCPTGLQWINNMCLPVNNTCPTGTYYNGFQCVSYQTCGNNMVWNSSVVQCVCPLSSFWNGNTCILCSGGMVYNGVQCSCPSGTFYNTSTSSCAQNSQSFCQNVSHANWNGTNCVCLPGYTVVNNECICYGVELTNWCNLCYQKPNSVYSNGLCMCLSTYYQVNGSCVQIQNVNSTNSTQLQICNIGTYWDSQIKQCLVCSQGCLSCQNCYNCIQCTPAYNYNYQTFLCNQKCGDGLRFTLECDDGNNNNGDGCSYDCRTQLGYACSGGSPNSKDTCSSATPSAVTLNMTGQAHLYGKILINIRLNYLPSSLSQVLSNCSNQCYSILTANITTPYVSATSIVTKYIGGSTPGFSLEVLFGKQPINSFTMKVGINQSLKTQYFGTVDITNTISINVSPSYLAVIQDADILS